LLIKYYIFKYKSKIKNNFIIKKLITIYNLLEINWGLGIGDWGFGVWGVGQ